MVSGAWSYVVHQSKTGSYEADWKRTKCGTYRDLATQPDLITTWGATVTPANPPLCEYPRMQMARPSTTMTCLNGLWEFELTVQGAAIPFGRTLKQTIFVPFPLESCLSGIYVPPHQKNPRYLST